MNDSMSEMLLVGLSQSEWEQLMQYLGVNQAEGDESMDIIIRKLTNQIY
tara:strand:+ start:252 stop:398 length:147 start_codon:yes stop_codon:yes gene_type:complete